MSVYLEEIKKQAVNVKEIATKLRKKNIEEKTKQILVEELAEIIKKKDELWLALANEKPLETYSIKISKNDVILDFWEKKISLIKEFEKHSTNTINFFVIEWFDPLQYIRWTKQRALTLPEEQLEATMKQLWYEHTNDIADNIIFIPRQHNYQPLCLNAIAHEMWHIMCNDISTSMIDEERNAHLRWLKFIKKIQEKYKIRTWALDSRISRLWLLSYQAKQSLYQNDPKLLKQLDPKFIHSENKFIKLQQDSPKWMFL